MSFGGLEACPEPATCALFAQGGVARAMGPFRCVRA